MKRLKFVSIMMIMVLISACAFLGATNTTPANIGVTAYEAAGATLTQAYNIEKAMLKNGTITEAQDKEFQLGPYTKAVACYKAIGSAAVAVVTATDTTGKATAQQKFNALNAELPGLVAEVLKFINK